MDEILAFKKLQRRQRDAAELLWGDGRLRANLTDEQADQLLIWGADYAHNQLNQTIGLPDDEADAWADSLLARLRRVLRRTARLAGSAQAGAAGFLQDELHALADDWHALTGGQLAAPDQLAAQIQLNPVQSFAILMTAISSNLEEE